MEGLMFLVGFMVIIFLMPFLWIVFIQKITSQNKPIKSKKFGLSMLLFFVFLLLFIFVVFSVVDQMLDGQVVLHAKYIKEPIVYSFKEDSLQFLIYLVMNIGFCIALGFFTRKLFYQWRGKK